MTKGVINFVINNMKQNTSSKMSKGVFNFVIINMKQHTIFEVSKGNIDTKKLSIKYN
jgi:hypothetical protein